MPSLISVEKNIDSAFDNLPSNTAECLTFKLVQNIKRFYSVNFY